MKRLTTGGSTVQDLYLLSSSSFFFFFFWSKRRLVDGTLKGAEHHRSCRSAEQIHARKPMGASSRVRERSRETGAVISAFASSSFAKFRTAVLQRRKNTFLGRKVPLDVALRFAAPLVAWLHASVYVEGKLSAFWCRPSLSHHRETCFRDPRKQLTWAEDSQQEVLALFGHFARTALRPGVKSAQFFHGVTRPNDVTSPFTSKKRSRPVWTRPYPVPESTRTTRQPIFGFNSRPFCLCNKLDLNRTKSNLFMLRPPESHGTFPFLKLPAVTVLYRSNLI